MQHSIVARYAAWPARFVHPPARARERRLGLRSTAAFVNAPSRRTVLHRPEVGPLAALRAPWRSLTVAPTRPATGGPPHPVVAMSWTRSSQAGGARRRPVATAWRG